MYQYNMFLENSFIVCIDDIYKRCSRETLFYDTFENLS